MSIYKDYKVLIQYGDKILATYTLHTEWEDGEFTNVSSTYTVGEPNNEPFEIEDEVVDMILEAESAHGKEIINEYTVEWFLIN